MDSEERPIVKKAGRSAFSRLKQERERHGWSQSELAERIKTTQVNVSRWEKGSTFARPYFPQRLREVFGKSLEDLALFTEGEGGSNEEASADSTSPNSLLHPARLPLWNI